MYKNSNAYSIGHTAPPVQKWYKLTTPSQFYRVLKFNFFSIRFLDFIRKKASKTPQTITYVNSPPVSNSECIHLFICPSTVSYEKIGRAYPILQNMTM